MCVLTAVEPPTTDLFESVPGGYEDGLRVTVGQHFEVQRGMVVAGAEGPHMGVPHVDHPRKLGYLGAGGE